MKFSVESRRVENPEPGQGLWPTYDRFLDSLCFPGARVLDLGCGYRYKSPLRKLEDRATCVGVDIDPLVYRQKLRLKARADAHILPFADDSFDLIICRYVLEHIENPSRVFSEAARVLRGGGNLFLLTNSCYNPVVWVGRFVPQKWHRILVQKLLGNKKIDYDNAPLFYRANTGKSLLTLCEKVGFTECRIIHISGMYGYFGSPLLRLAVFTAGNLLTDNNVLAFLKLNLMVVATKPRVREADGS